MGKIKAGVDRHKVAPRFSNKQIKGSFIRVVSLKKEWDKAKNIDPLRIEGDENKIYKKKRISPLSYFDTTRDTIKGKFPRKREKLLHFVRKLFTNQIIGKKNVFLTFCLQFGFFFYTTKFHFFCTNFSFC